MAKHFVPGVWQLGSDAIIILALQAAPAGLLIYRLIIGYEFCKVL
jgi:hypothetical protein